MTAGEGVVNPDLATPLAMLERMWLIRAFEEHGIKFSLPSRHSYWKHDQEQGALEVKVVAEAMTQSNDSSS